MVVGTHTHPQTPTRSISAGPTAPAPVVQRPLKAGTWTFPLSYSLKEKKQSSLHRALFSFILRIENQAFYLFVLFLTSNSTVSKPRGVNPNLKTEYGLNFGAPWAAGCQLTRAHLPRAHPLYLPSWKDFSVSAMAHGSPGSPCLPLSAREPLEGSSGRDALKPQNSSRDQWAAFPFLCSGLTSPRVNSLAHTRTHTHRDYPHAHSNSNLIKRN